ncbi:MAG: response regulator [Eubacteriales bacterium]|nr:response regulator [Eubacteriales bacterium]
MKIIYVDDEPLAIRKFEMTVRDLPDVEDVQTFSTGKAALDFVRGHSIDAAFLDIELPDIRGMELAQTIQMYDENIRIFFVTAYSQYALDAFGVSALGYLLKPYSATTLAKELNKAKRMRNIQRHTVFVQTIPTFDVYIDGELFPITSPKPKELLALLVDRNGSSISSGQAISALWEDRPEDEKTKALYRMTVKRLREILITAGIDFIASTDGPQKYVHTDAFGCDYFRLLSGDELTLSRYNGEYMREYSWAEETNAILTNLKEARMHSHGREDARY